MRLNPSDSKTFHGECYKKVKFSSIEEKTLTITSIQKLEWTGGIPAKAEGALVGHVQKIYILETYWARNLKFYKNIQ